MNGDDLDVTRDRWGGLTAADELVDVFAGLERAAAANAPVVPKWVRIDDFDQDQSWT